MGFRSLKIVLLAVSALLLSGRPPVDAAAASSVWRPVPLDGGIVTGLGAGAGPSAAIWAVTPYSGIFRSLDNGTTWSRTRTSPTLRGVLAGVDPNDGDRACVVFLNPGSSFAWVALFVTADGGATWSRSTGLGKDFVYQVAFDPHDPGVVYAAASRGLYRSTDGGRSWSLLWQGERGGSVYAIAVAPDDPQLLLVSTLDRVYRSTDGGATFTEVSRSGMYNGFAFDPRDPGRIYGTSGPLFRSTDRGLTWEWIGRNFQLAFESVAVGGDGTLHTATQAGVIRSFDGGATFTPAATPDLTRRHPDDRLQDVVPLANGDVLASGARGIWRLAADEKGWRAASRGIHALDAPDLAMTAGGRLLMSVPDNAVFRSDDGGRRFRSSTQGLRGPLGVPGLHLVPAPSSPRVVYGSGSFGALFRSDDGGVTWSPRTFPNPAPLVRVLAVHPADPDLVFAGGDEDNPRGDYGKCHALRSRDGGTTWDCLEGDDLYTLTALVFDPRQPRRLLALGDSRFLVSEDEGETWREAGRGLPAPDGVYPIALALDARGRVLVGTSNGRVLQSLDGGASFSQVSRGLPRITVQSLLPDPLRSDTIYAILLDVVQVQRSVFRSQDGGRRWERLDRGLPRFSGALALDAARGLLFAGTQGRGLYVLDVR